MLTPEQIKRIKNASYLSWSAVIGWITVIIGIVLLWAGWSNIDSYLNKAIAPYQLGAGVSLLLFGLLLAGIGAVHSQLKLITAILAPELAEEEKKADA